MGGRGTLLGVLLVLLAACSPGGEPAAPPATPTTMPLPPRPHDVPIDGLDPCTLLTEEQRAELGLEQPPVFANGRSPLYRADTPLCSIGGFEPRAIAVAVQVVTTAGIELYTSGELLVDVQPLQVAGFPAVLAVPPDSPEFCMVVVDVAPGQLVDIQFRDGGRKPPIPQEQLCRDAEQTAGLVMETLLSLR